MLPRPPGAGDAAKRLNGPKRHIVVHTMGLLLDVVITAPSAPRPATPPAALLWGPRRACPRVRLAWG